ncbi:hypothetical protein MTO96_027662 [Rhipicephalus appendiculatus]
MPPSEGELAATRHFLDAGVEYDAPGNALLLPVAVLMSPVLYPEDVPVEMVMSTLGPLMAEELHRALLPPPDDTDLWTSETRHAIDRFEQCLRSLWLSKTNETLTPSPAVEGSRGVGLLGAYATGELLFWVQGARMAFAGLQEALSGFQRATNWPSYWRRAQKTFFRRFCLMRCSDEQAKFANSLSTAARQHGRVRAGLRMPDHRTQRRRGRQLLLAPIASLINFDFLGM